jgi:hypothetical protein
VLEQVDEAIADGVIQVIDKPGRDETVGKVEALSRGTLNRRRSEEKRAYTPGERVQLIVEATRRAVVDTATLEKQVAATLQELADATDIAFVSSPDDSRASFALPAEPRGPATAELAATLGELLAETQE